MPAPLERSSAAESVHHRLKYVRAAGAEPSSRYVRAADIPPPRAATPKAG